MLKKKIILYSMDNKKIESNGNIKKKNKNIEIIDIVYNKLSSLMIHIDFLFKNKLMKQEVYIEQMNILTELNNKIINLETVNEKKKLNKNENFLNEINKLFMKITNSKI